MSYGQYVAMEYARRGHLPEWKEPKAPPRPEKAVTCRCCGKVFDRGDRNGNTKYCSEECYRENGARVAKERARQRKPEGGWEERACIVCGKVFSMEGIHGSVRVCSEGCRQKRREQRRKERECLTKSI
jgi:predicted nucleic acid-binding Zn ribbon protein